GKCSNEDQSMNATDRAARDRQIIGDFLAGMEARVIADKYELCEARVGQIYQRYKKANGIAEDRRRRSRKRAERAIARERERRERAIERAGELAHILAAMHAGAVLQLNLGRGQRWILLNGTGATFITAALAREVRERREIVGAGDTLFRGTPSQTWHYTL